MRFIKTRHCKWMISVSFCFIYYSGVAINSHFCIEFPCVHWILMCTLNSHLSTEFPCFVLNSNVCIEFSCLQSLPMFIFDFHVYIEFSCLQSLPMFMLNSHVYIEFPCFNWIPMFILNSHVYIEFSCLHWISLFTFNFHIYFEFPWHCSNTVSYAWWGNVFELHHIMSMAIAGKVSDLVGITSQFWAIPQVLSRPWVNLNRLP